MAILYIAIALVSLYVAAVGEGITVGIAIIVGWIAFGAFQIQIRRYFKNLKDGAPPGATDDEDDQIRLPPA